MRPEDNFGSLFSPSTVCVPGTELKTLSRFGGECLSPLGHLASPSLFISILTFSERSQETQIMKLLETCSKGSGLFWLMFPVRGKRMYFWHCGSSEPSLSLRPNCPIITSNILHLHSAFFSSVFLFFLSVYFKHDWEARAMILLLGTLLSYGHSTACLSIAQRCRAAVLSCHWHYSRVIRSRPVQALSESSSWSWQWIQFALDHLQPLLYSQHV